MLRTRFTISLIKRLSCILLLCLTACAPAVRQLIPTQRPTETATLVPTATDTPNAAFTATPAPMTSTFGPTPTSLFGATSPPAGVVTATATENLNPNAPRIEFFTSDVIAVSPGDSVRLLWSTRNVTGATIYRLTPTGERGNLWNVPPDGNLAIPTRKSDRLQITFLIVVGTGNQAQEQRLTIPIACPDSWFFVGAPDSCPSGAAQPTVITEQSFERGRMIYLENRNRVYALFNDGRDPAWLSFENKYDPAIHPEMDENFEKAIPPGFFQPLRKLGFIWRGSDAVRNRLGLGTQAESNYDGFIQTVNDPNGRENLYINSADGSIIQLLPEGVGWQLINPS